MTLVDLFELFIIIVAFIAGVFVGVALFNRSLRKHLGDSSPRLTPFTVTIFVVAALVGLSVGVLVTAKPDFIERIPLLPLAIILSSILGVMFAHGVKGLIEGIVPCKWSWYRLHAEPLSFLTTVAVYLAGSLCILFLVIKEITLS